MNNLDSGHASQVPTLQIAVRKVLDDSPLKDAMSGDSRRDLTTRLIDAYHVGDQLAVAAVENVLHEAKCDVDLAADLARRVTVALVDAAEHLR